MFKMETPITGAVATGSLFTPYWHPYMETISEGAASIIPIFALMWLGVQIVRALWTWPGKS
jgi:hypothetical protein